MNNTIKKLVQDLEAKARSSDKAAENSRKAAQKYLDDAKLYDNNANEYRATIAILTNLPNQDQPADGKAA